MRINTALLDQIELLYLANPGWSGVRMHEWIATTKIHGNTCPGRDGAECHCPLLYPAPGGEAYGVRAVQDALCRVRQRLRARVDSSREENRALAVARHDASFKVAAESGNTRDMIAAASRRAELDGSHVAAEEAARPSLFARVRALMVAVVDYEPGEVEPRTYTPEQARFQLERLERLLIAADDGAARFYRLGEPPADEAQRLTWRRNLLDEAIHQAVTSPHVHPDKKRDAIIKGAGTASMITEGTSLAERVQTLEEKVSKI